MSIVWYMKVKREKLWCRQAAELMHIKVPAILTTLHQQRQDIIVAFIISEDFQEMLPDMIIEQADIRIIVEQRLIIITQIHIVIIPIRYVREAQVRERLPEAELVLENK